MDFCLIFSPFLCINILNCRYFHADRSTFIKNNKRQKIEKKTFDFLMKNSKRS